MDMPTWVLLEERGEEETDRCIQPALAHADTSCLVSLTDNNNSRGAIRRFHLILVPYKLENVAWHQLYIRIKNVSLYSTSW